MLNLNDWINNKIKYQLLAKIVTTLIWSRSKSTQVSSNFLY